MFKVIGSFIAVAGLALSAGQTAEAHGFGYHGHGSPVHRYDVFYRTKHMPGWLRKDRRFRQWYAHSPHRFNHHLHWADLHYAYRWERRFNDRRFYRSHFRMTHRMTHRIKRDRKRGRRNRSGW